MTYRIGSDLITVICDVCGDSEFRSKGELSNFQATRALWAEIANKGWTSSSVKHFCPKCSSGK